MNAKHASTTVAVILVLYHTSMGAIVTNVTFTVASLITTNRPSPGSRPVMEIWPNHLDFGKVPAVPGSMATNFFTIRNVGGGRLTGTARTSRPFSILSGGTYNLSSNESQIVVVTFNPMLVAVASDTNKIVILTGEGESRVGLTGLPAPAPPTGLKAVPKTKAIAGQS
jgi:hypothetical protein